MKSNLGIGCRPAPLLDNNLNQMELFIALPQRRLLQRHAGQTGPPAGPGSRLRLPGVNVETELANKSSLLHWTQRLLSERNANRAFGWGLLPRPGRV